MQLSGTLRSWNDDRGFGFIAPTHGGAEIFVHFSEFPRDGSRPTVGEKLSYELGRGRDGKPQAVKVVRLAVGADRPVRTSGVKTKGAKPSLLGSLALVAIVAVAGAWGYKHLSASQHRQALAAETVPTPSRTVAAPTTAEPTPVATTFRCDGRTHCSQMTSCAEATWFINHCPGTKMDGNNDGIPCEQQWCTEPSRR
jgi:cold shock CspA family protein